MADLQTAYQALEHEHAQVEGEIRALEADLERAATEREDAEREFETENERLGAFEKLVFGTGDHSVNLSLSALSIGQRGAIPPLSAMAGMIRPGG